MPLTPAVIFGAFDRHNFGDLLIARVVARQLPRRELLFAGLAARDLRNEGGFATHALAQIARFARGREIDVIHAGGEVLGCNAWEAAVMIAPPPRVQATIDEETAWRRDPRAWARARFGMESAAPYVLAKTALPGVRVRQLVVNAAGGADLDAREAVLRADALAALRSADWLSVRDRRTQAQLEAHGMRARLTPDPAAMTAVLFDAAIQRHAARMPVRAIREAFTHGYAAVQFSADFGDDATLDRLAHELERIANAHGVGIALFRAGAAPWHDSLDVYRRLAARLPAQAVRVFESLNLWDICALIAHARVFCGSSLHGRIVATAHAIARVNIARNHSFGMPGIGSHKHVAYVSTWEAQDVPQIVTVDSLADAAAEALRVDRQTLRIQAASLAQRCRREFEALRAALD
ncbi:polysaccharide pyruvyl transferase family protein [Paraburkholderia sp. J41]|uniref:polysaccharide pyruvyl transferase family protein n=1 Tax=Paraburkholderia sp. J41 TaxID=2805433 RepID=UPI002AC33B08|nr:polysaccharide pyruvyl transferase family protein [Paraburkholderia sp. J41]